MTVVGGEALRDCLVASGAVPALARLCFCLESPWPARVLDGSVEVASCATLAPAMRALTPVEAAVAVAIGGSVLAVTLPAFLGSLQASQLVEPLSGLERLAGRASALAAGRAPSEAYPATVELTPSRVPRGERLLAPPGSWDHPTWQELGFAPTAPHAFAFGFSSENGELLATFRAYAHGDLDGDGALSTFAVSGASAEGAAPIVHPMEIHREVE